MMVLFVDYLQSRSVGEGAKSIYQRFKKVIRYAIEHDVILKDLTYKNVDYSNKLLKFEQNGEDRAAYGEQLLKKLEKQLNTKGLNERRFREFRRLYLVYPQLKDEVLHYVMSGSEIRHTPSAEFIAPIRHTPSAKLQLTDKQNNLGVFKVMDSVTGEVLKNIKNIKGNAIYDLYLWDKKL